MTLQPLFWAPTHRALLDEDGSTYHRVFCPDVANRDGVAARFVEAGEPLPWVDAPHQCRRCRPEVELRLSEHGDGR